MEYFENIVPETAQVKFDEGNHFDVVPQHEGGTILAVSTVRILRSAGDFVPVSAHGAMVHIGNTGVIPAVDGTIFNGRPPITDFYRLICIPGLIGGMAVGRVTGTGALGFRPHAA